MALSNPWGTPSKLVTTIMVTLSAAAMGLTIWYLLPGLPYTLVGLAVAGLIVVVPLMTRWPITPRRAGFSAALWFCVGLPGAYVFGIPVVVASLLLALGVAGTLLRDRFTREPSLVMDAV